MVYSEVFNNVFEGCNILKKYAAKIHLPGNGVALHTTELSRVLAWLAFGDFHHKVQMQLQWTVAYSWAFLL